MSGGFSRLYTGQSEIDFLGRRKLWFAISALLILFSVTMLLVRGLNYGIEFAGGVSIQARIDDQGPLGGESDSQIVSEMRSALEQTEAGDAQIQVAESGEERLVLVQTKEIEDSEGQEQLVAVVSETVGASLAETDSSRVGSKWGGEITEKAVRALVIFMVVILLFISWRFEWKTALGAVAALIHDMTITAGVYSAVGFEVTPSTVVAILTILGYSLYDSVVVFDKVEENVELYAGGGKTTYESAANMALNQVFMRSLNTSLTSLLPIGALLFVGVGLLGAGTLKDLALALLVGMLAGTYSSIFVATPILTVLKESEPRYQGIREKVLRDARKAEGTRGGEREREPEAAEVVPAVQSAQRMPAARPINKPRAGSKKKKRRKR